MTDDCEVWAGSDRKEYCKLCKRDTERSVKNAEKMGENAVKISLTLLVICFVLSGIAWSAKSDVRNFRISSQKDMMYFNLKVQEINRDQKKIKRDLAKIAEFVDLLKQGKIKPVKP